MSLHRLHIQGFRNLKTSRLSFSDINFIYGKNGSGKTSLLEAIYFLSTGKSFRTNKQNYAISQGETSFTLFGIVAHPKFGETHLGYSRSLNELPRVRINQKDAKSASALANLLPVIIIQPSTFTLLSGSSKFRRRFIDWGVFHVEHQFSQIWSQYSQIVKQRNQLLKKPNVDVLQLKIWDDQLVEYGNKLNECRVRYYEQFLECWKIIKEELDISFDIKMSFARGWNNDSDLASVLNDSREKDIISGYTHYGPHRADLRMSINRRAVEETLSRGQMKLLTCSLMLAQIALFTSVKGYSPVLLIDDISSELDEVSLNTLLNKVYNSESQLFITSIEHLDFAGLYPPADRKYKMFHVEHGTITEEPTLQERI